MASDQFSMSGSALIVAINALTLKRTRLAGIRQPGKVAARAPPDMAATAALPSPRSTGAST